MTEIPQEAIEAVVKWFVDRGFDPDYRRAQTVIEAALPFLRSQWEQEDRDTRWGPALGAARKQWREELLSDEAIERVAASIFDCDYPDRWLNCPLDVQGPYRAEARLAIRAALGEAAA